MTTSTTLYVDPIGGLAGDMLCAALFDLGLNFAVWKRELEKLHITLPELSLTTVQRGVFRAQYFHVHKPESSGTSHHSHEHRHQHDHSHQHSHHHAHTHHHDQNGPQPENWESSHRSWREIQRIIINSDLSNTIQKRSLLVFEKLAQSEARMHGMSVDDVVFHEVGAIDSIVDIIGFCIGSVLLGIDQILCSSLPLSGGTIRSAHGVIPLPAPATLDILTGWNSHVGHHNHEQVTPTGAAIVAALGTQADFPAMTIRGTGYGAGTRNPSSYANIVRLTLGEVEKTMARNDKTPIDIIEIRCNIDDMTGEAFGYLLSQLQEQNALDVFSQPIQMKKNRPGILLTVLCRSNNFDAICHTIFHNSSTFGLRYSHQKRVIMQRSFQKVETNFGEATIKKGRWKNIIKRSVEFEDMVTIASTANISLFEAQQLILNHDPKP